MFSKELRDLEMNELVNRTVYNTISVTVENSLADYGKSLDNVIASYETGESDIEKTLLERRN